MRASSVILPDNRSDVNFYPKSSFCRHADVSGFPYVEKVLDAFGEPLETWDGWCVPCPLPTHGDDGVDETPSVRVTIGAKGRILVTCRPGCSTEKILAAVGLTMSDLFCPEGEEPMPTLCAAPREVTEADAVLRDRVYSYLLSILGLTAAHRDGLRSRGLSDTTIARDGYRTLVRTDVGKLGASVHREFGDDVYRVPGLVRGPHGPTVLGQPGLVVPCRDPLGRVAALKVRVDDDARKSGGGKYSYLSGGDASSGAPVHCPPGRPSGDAVRVSEGELKAAVATELSGLYTVSVPGVSNWLPVLQTLKSYDPRHVLVAYDWPDIIRKLQVRGQLVAFLGALREGGYSVGIETWEHDPATGSPKGIDDALAAGAARREHWGEEADKVLASLTGAPAAKKSAVRLESVDLTTVVPEQVDWLWHHRIPRGGISGVDGDPGLGKTLFEVAVAAAVTKGRPVIEGGVSTGDPADVMIFSAEDSLKHTLVPRLMVAGADLGRVHAPTVHDSKGPRLLTIPDDVGLLEEFVEEKRVALLIFDPFFAFLSEGYDSHKDAEVRRALYPLAQMAERTGVAILMVRHLNKGEGPALYRGGGSIAISAAARSVMLLGVDPSDRDVRVLAPVKANLAPPVKSLAFRIEMKDCTVRNQKGLLVTTKVPCVKWEGETDLKDNDLVARQEKKTKREDVAAWLREFLRGGRQASEDVNSMARVLGYAERTVVRAREDVGVVPYQEGGRWYCELPKEDATQKSS